MLMRIIVGFKGVGFRALRWILFIIFMHRDDSTRDCWHFQVMQIFVNLILALCS